VTSRRGMLPPRRHEERFFDDAHRDNLYSPGGLVKHDLPRAAVFVSSDFRKRARENVSD